MHTLHTYYCYGGLAYGSFSVQVSVYDVRLSGRYMVHVNTQSFVLSFGNVISIS